MVSDRSRSRRACGCDRQQRVRLALRGTRADSGERRRNRRIAGRPDLFRLLRRGASRARLNRSTQSPSALPTLVADKVRGRSLPARPCSSGSNGTRTGLRRSGNAPLLDESLHRRRGVDPRKSGDGDASFGHQHLGTRSGAGSPFAEVGSQRSTRYPCAVWRPSYGRMRV